MLCSASNVSNHNKAKGIKGGETHSLGDTIDEHSKQRHSNERQEPNRKTKEQPLPIAEPLPLLLLGEVNTCKIWLQKLAHQTPRSKVALQEDDQVPLGEEHARSKDDRRRAKPRGLVERPETGGREDEPADAGEIGSPKDDERDETFASEADEEHREGLGHARGLGTSILDGVVPEVGVVHGTQLAGVRLVLVLLDIGLVDPVQGVHEQVIQGRRQVAHQRHEEQRDLEDVRLNEAEATDDLVVPGDMVKGEKKGGEP